MKDNNKIEAVEKEQCKWNSEWDNNMVFYHQNMRHWNSTNDAVQNAIQSNRPIPPVTFAAHTLLDYMKEELDYQILRMKERGRVEKSDVTAYFSSTNAKWMCWSYLCKATIEKKVVSPKKVAFETTLSLQGIRSIFEVAVDAGWALVMHVDGKKHYCASNVSMMAYFERAKREALLAETNWFRALSTFRSLIKYLPDEPIDRTIDWFEKDK